MLGMLCVAAGAVVGAVVVGGLERGYFGRHCPNCGARLAKDAHVCSNCDAELSHK